jgi:hypothetical protein
MTIRSDRQDFDETAAFAVGQSIAACAIRSDLILAGLLLLTGP